MNRRGPGRIRGQAAAEFVVSLAVFVPLFILVPILGKYFDIKQKTIESSRYAAWERTIWSDRGTGWGDDPVNSKTDADIVKEVDARLLGHPLQGLHDNKASKNPLWHVRKKNKDNRLLSATGSGSSARSQLDVYEKTTPVTGLLVDMFAFKGLSGVPGGEVIIAVGDAIDTVGSAISLVAEGCEIGIDLENGMAVGDLNFADISVTTPVKNMVYEGGGGLAIKAGSGILTNAWTAPAVSDEAYRARVGRLTLAEPVNCVTGPAKFVFGKLSLGPDLPLYGEIEDAHVVEDTLNPTALPPGIKYQNKK